MGLQEILMQIVFFINDYVIPLLVSVALLVFFWNLFRFGFVEGLSADGRERAKKLMLWGIVAFVIMTSLWGIIQIFSIAFDFNTRTATPDYLNARCNEFRNSTEYEDCIEIRGFAPEPSIENFIDGELPVPNNINNDPFREFDPFEGTTPGGSAVQPV